MRQCHGDENVPLSHFGNILQLEKQGHQRHEGEEKSPVVDRVGQMFRQGEIVTLFYSTADDEPVENDEKRGQQRGQLIFDPLVEEDDGEASRADQEEEKVQESFSWSLHFLTPFSKQ